MEVPFRSWRVRSEESDDCGKFLRSARRPAGIRAPNGEDFFGLEPVRAEIVEARPSRRAVRV